MQGKKYRGVPIKLWSSMLTGMGAVATPVEVSELATALATGLVVGQENPLPNIYNLKLYEVQKYVMLTGHMQSILSVFVNERVWQQVPAADRKIMEDTMIEVGTKTLDWDRETFGQVPQGARGQRHGVRRAEGRPRRRGLPQGGARAGEQGLPRVGQVHRADPRSEVTPAMLRCSTECARCRWASLVLLAALIVTPLAQITMRGVFNVPMAGAEELAQVLPDLPHLRRRFATCRARAGRSAWRSSRCCCRRGRAGSCSSLIELAGVAFFAVLFVASLITVSRNLNSVTPVLEIPFWLFFAPLVLGSLLLVVEALIMLAHTWRKRRPEEKHTVLT